MKNYLPNQHELRQAIFTAVAVFVLAIIIGTIGGAARRAFFHNDYYWQERGMHMSGNEDMPGMNMSQYDDGGGSSMSMDDMMKDMNASLQGLKGDDLDKEFLKEMIVHHQGAVDMAKVLQAGTKRPELQKMANDIITVQTKEIQMMQGWLDAWFPANK